MNALIDSTLITLSFPYLPISPSSLPPFLSLAEIQIKEVETTNPSRLFAACLTSLGNTILKVRQVHRHIT